MREVLKPNFKAIKCSTYVFITGDEVIDYTSQQIFKSTYRHKIDLQPITDVCKGDREFARSLIVKEWRWIAGDVEKRAEKVLLYFIFLFCC